MVSKLGLRDHEKPKVGIWSPTLKNTGLLGFDERPDPFFPPLARGHRLLPSRRELHFGFGFVFCRVREFFASQIETLMLAT